MAVRPRSVSSQARQNFGGTTIEGLHELEKGRLRGVVMSTVRAATEKSKNSDGREIFWRVEIYLYSFKLKFV
jgi:hypothetical protein